MNALQAGQNYIAAIKCGPQHTERVFRRVRLIVQTSGSGSC